MRDLLWLDSRAGLIVGAAMLALAGWLAELYRMPLAWVVGIGLVNLLYGSCSALLARRAERPRALLLLLIGANAAWALGCVAAAALLRDRVSPLGVASLLAEGVFVGGLAALEWHQRERLLRRG